jgi:hypothetical protein
MKKLFFTIVTAFITLHSSAQIAKDLMVGAHTDLVKSDNDGYFEKIQAGAEVNYFLSRKFTATGGIEYWSQGKQVSFVMGGRWYPIPDAFVRMRGLIGANDFALGAGWAKPLDERWRFEAMADLYTRGDIAIRAGMMYVIRRKN